MWNMEGGGVTVDKKTSGKRSGDEWEVKWKRRRNEGRWKRIRNKAWIEGGGG